MSPWLLDASVLVPLLVNEPASGAMRAWAGEQGDTAIISDWAAGEVSSAVARLVRMGELAGDDARVRLEAFDALRSAGFATLSLHSDDIAVATRLVRQFDLGLRLPDAIHLALAVRAGAAVVTRDQLLARAARAVGVAVMVPA